MARKTPTFFYERFTLFGLHPAWFWLFFGLALFSIGVYFVRLDDLPGYWIIWAFYAQGYMFWPIILIWIYKNFLQIIEFQKDIFWVNDKEYTLWIENQVKRIFSFESLSVKITVIIIPIIVPFAIYLSLLQYPGNSKLLYVLTGIGIAPLGFIGGQAAYILLNLLQCLVELSKRQVNVPFYHLPNPNISRLQGYYSNLTVIVTAIYIHLLTGLWLSPVGFPPIIIIIMTIGGFYPLGLFLFTVIYTHKITLRIKQAHLSIINEEVHETLIRAIKSKSSSGYEILKHVMEVQDKIQNIREWPFDLSGTITFIITLVTAIAQLVFTIIRTP